VDNNELSKHGSLLLGIDQKTSRVESGFNLISASIILFIMIFVVIEVLGRYLFNHPIQGHHEIVVALMAPLVFLGIAYTEQQGGHIRMDLLISRIPKGWLYYGLEILLRLCCLVVSGLFVVKGIGFTLFMYKVGHASELLNFPHWPFQLCVVVGCFLLCIRFIVEILQYITGFWAWRGKSN